MTAPGVPGRLPGTCSEQAAAALLPTRLWRLSLVLTAKAFTPCHTLAGASTDLAGGGPQHADTLDFVPGRGRMLGGLACPSASQAAETTPQTGRSGRFDRDIPVLTSPHLDLAGSTYAALTVPVSAGEARPHDRQQDVGFAR